jgi:ABC-2 type transport system ATP-binding protein
MTTAPPILETRGLTKRFGSRTTVSDISLTVPAGCAFGFLGHNGAGKTTVIRMLVSLTRPSAGAIWIAGQSLAGHREQVLARVGAIVEEPRFHPHLTGRENLRVVAAARGPQARRRIEPALERVGLCDRGDDLVGEGRTVFVSSHLLDEIEKTCHAAAVIDRGRLIAQGPISELIGDTHTHYELTCDNPRAALNLLAGYPAVVQASQTPSGLRVTLTDPRAAGAVTTLLIEAGISVTSFAPVRTSLADRFLGLTSRVGGNA